MRTSLTGRAVKLGRSNVRRRTRCLGAMVVLPLAASCWSWRPVPGAGLAPSQFEHVEHARVFLHDGTELDIRHVIITPDSIVGQGGATSSRLAVARRDVEAIDTRSAEPLSNFLGGALAVLAGFFLVFHL
jgi:hypothetical protein